MKHRYTMHGIAPVPTPDDRQFVLDFQGECSPAQAVNVNPCVRAHGFGPQGATCKTCALLWCHETRAGKRFYKCRLRKCTFGMATDHRVRWDACAQYREKK